MSVNLLLLLGLIMLKKINIIQQMHLDECYPSKYWAWDTMSMKNRIHRTAFRHLVGANIQPGP